MVKVSIQKFILLICLIILKNTYINTLEINSVYPHCLLLSNKNLLIVHKTGIYIYDSSLENIIFNYYFEDNNIISSDTIGASISIFQETQSTESYVFILAKNILYIISSLQNSFVLNQDLNQYLLSLSDYTLYY